MGVRRLFGYAPGVAARTTLFTIGYQGRTPAQLVLRLREAAVARVLDVRASPRSPRPGFSKGALARTLAVAGIEYLHLAAAGNPFHAEAEADLEAALARYRAHLADHGEIAVRVVAAAEGARTALLCAEADARRCHRSVLVEAVRCIAPELAVVHL